MRFFNTAGPVNCEDHYCIPPLTRLDFDEVRMLIDQKKYFVLHAPRQTGKTSTLLALADYLNAEGQYNALYVNVEIAQSAREDVDAAMRAVLGSIAGQAALKLKDKTLSDIFPDIINKYGGHGALSSILEHWASENPKPTVLFLDEVDALVGDTLISLLRQIRAGYTNRPAGFPQSIILCGIRDVRDYRIHSSKDKSVITGGSVFNIKAESLRMSDFIESEVNALLQQHTDETGQVFEPEALLLIWNFTWGQPWLVNALAYEVCFEMKENRDRSIPITAEMVRQAKENLILRRETHLDQLADKLKEERIKRIIIPMLQGVERPSQLNDDDIAYARDLGLIRVESGQIVIANAIYREVIPRELTYSTQYTISHQQSWYITDDGRIDMEKLLSAFQQFFREHSEHWVERFDYKEAGPQLLLQAFLQRIINSGGRVEREYGLGRKRTDLLMMWKHPAGVQRVVIELKILYGSLEKTIEEGLRQTFGYMDKCGSDDGYLVIFDRSEKKWDEKIFCREERFEGKGIRVWGM